MLGGPAVSQIPVEPTACLAARIVKPLAKGVKESVGWLSYMVEESQYAVPGDNNNARQNNL